MSKHNRIDYLFQIHSHIYENIKFADQKAAALTVTSSAIIGALHSGDLFLIKSEPHIPQVYCTLFSILVFLLLCFGVLLSALVILPRGETFGNYVGPSDLALSFKIAHNGTYKKFSENLDKATESELQDHLSALVFIRAKINDRKYTFLKWTIYFSISGWLGAGVLVLTKTFILQDAV